MAIFHCQVKIISRKTSKSKSSVASAAYRAGEKLRDEQKDIIFDYSRKNDVYYSEIVAPEGSPLFVYDRQQLWNRIEELEKRKDAQLAREVIVGIPVELRNDQRVELVREFALENFVSRGMVVDIGFHKFDSHNPHAHMMMPTRSLAPDGFGKKNREWNNRHLVPVWREGWAELTNQYLEANGSLERIDHRSYAERGIEKVPQKHLGPTVFHMAEKGIVTDRAREHELITVANELMGKDLCETGWLQDKADTLSGNRITLIFERKGEKLISPNWPKEMVGKAEELISRKRQEGFDAILQSTANMEEEIRLYAINSNEKKTPLALVVDNTQKTHRVSNRQEILEGHFEGLSVPELLQVKQWIDERVGRGQRLLSDEFGHDLTLEDAEDFIEEKLSNNLAQRFRYEVEGLKERYGKKFRPDIADWVVTKKLLHEGHNRDEVAQAFQDGSPEIELRKEDAQEYITKTLDKLTEREEQLELELGY